MFLPMFKYMYMHVIYFCLYFLSSNKCILHGSRIYGNAKHFCLLYVHVIVIQMGCGQNTHKESMG